MAGTDIGDFGAGRFMPPCETAPAGEESGQTALDIAAQRIEAQGERAVNRMLIGWAILWVTGLLLGVAVVGGYLLKSWMGINLFAGHSALHDMFFAAKDLPHP